jgi:hypothetical protein
VEIKEMTRKELDELELYVGGTEDEWDLYCKLGEKTSVVVAVDNGRAYALLFRSGLGSNAKLVSMTGPRVHLQEDLEALEVDEALEDL